MLPTAWLVRSPNPIVGFDDPEQRHVSYADRLPRHPLASAMKASAQTTANIRLLDTSHNRSDEGREFETPTWHDQGVDDELGDNGTEMRAEVERIEAQLRHHPGRRAYSQVVDLERAWNTHRNASTNIIALVQAGETDEAMAVDLIHWQDDKRTAFLGASDAALHAYVGALSSLIDITRRIVRKQPQDLQTEFGRRLQAVLNVEGASFLGDLRNYLMHVGHAPWVVHAEVTGGHASARLLLRSEDLLLWNNWTAASNAYLHGQEAIYLSVVLPAYWAELHLLYVWLLDDVQRVHVVEIDAANELVRQRNLVLTGGQFEDQASFMAMVQKSVRDYREAKGSGPGIDTAT